jgi:mRNA interferase MazF
MMNCRRGEIVLVLFPDSNLRTSKRRPALVVQADQLSSDLPQTIVAMITSNMLRAGHPSRVPLNAGSENAKGSGLLMDSVIMADNLATVRYSEIDRVIGTLPDLAELERALRATLGL